MRCNGGGNRVFAGFMAAGLFVLAAGSAQAQVNTWTTRTPAPATFGHGAAIAYPGYGDFVYALRGNTTQTFYRYSISANSWTTLAPAPSTLNHGGALVGTGGDFLYALRANGTTTFWRYSISANTWSVMASTPATVRHAAGLGYTGSGDFIYALRGNNSSTFYRYSIGANSWTTLAAAPSTFDDGASMTYPGSGDFFYALRGNNTTGFLRYSISANTWTARASTPGAVDNLEGALAASGNPDHLYALRGNNNATFWRYTISTNAWAAVASTPAAIDRGGALSGFPSTSRFIFATRGSGTATFYRYEGTDLRSANVTVNQALGQPDTTASSPINFTVSFSEAVTGFGSSGVAISGTAGATTAVVTGGPSTYNVAISGMTVDGTVIVTIPAGAATDGANASLASTSTDNTVLYSTASPSVTVNQAAGQADPTAASPINFTVVFSETVSGFGAPASDITLSGTAGATTAAVTGGPTTFNVAVSGMTTDGTVIVTIPAGAAIDAVGNANFASSSSDNLVTYDTTGPVVTANQEAVQADPTANSPINFTVEFNEPVVGFGAEASDVTISGTGGATTAAVTGGPTIFNVAVSGMTGDGTVIVGIPAGAATDIVGNSSSASTSTDNTVTFDTTVPAVTVSQAAAQADPTPSSPINFTVEFSKPVSGFGAEPTDVTISGTAGAFAAVITGGPTTYTVEVSGMTLDGTVTVAIPAGAAIDPAGNLNSASTSADDTVTYDTTPPAVTVGQAAGQPDPTAIAPINFTVTFSEPVTGFGAETTDAILSGTAGATTTLITGGPTIYNIEVSGMTAEGAVTVTIPAGAAVDLAGNPSLVATGDDTVTFDVPSPGAKAGYCSGSASSAGAFGWPLGLLAGFILLASRGIRRNDYAGRTVPARRCTASRISRSVRPA